MILLPMQSGKTPDFLCLFMGKYPHYDHKMGWIEAWLKPPHKPSPGSRKSQSKCTYAGFLFHCHALITRDFVFIIRTME